MTNKIDYDQCAEMSVQISERIKIILENFPIANEKLLKNLAATSIHLAFFMRDIYDYKENKKTIIDKDEKKFLDDCGCKNDKSGAIWNLSNV